MRQRLYFNRYPTPQCPKKLLMGNTIPWNVANQTANFYQFPRIHEMIHKSCNIFTAFCTLATPSCLLEVFGKRMGSAF